MEITGLRELAHHRISVYVQQTQHIHSMLVQCWATVFDAVSTLHQHRINVSRLLCVAYHKYDVSVLAQKLCFGILDYICRQQIL